MFKGSYSVTITPTSNDGKIKVKSLEKYFNWQIRKRIGGLIILGSTGEFLSISDNNRLKMIKESSSIIDKCASILKPGGTIFFSTINRNPKSFLFAIIGAEYVLNLLPKGTHEYSKFLKPSEINDWCIAKGLDFKSIIGMSYNPFLQEYKLGDDTSVNYIVEVGT